METVSLFRRVFLGWYLVRRSPVSPCARFVSFPLPMKTRKHVSSYKYADLLRVSGRYPNALHMILSDFTRFSVVSSSGILEVSINEQSGGRYAPC